MTPLNLLIVSRSELHRDPRVLRQIEALGSDFEITTCGFTPSGVEAVRAHLPLEKEVGAPRDFPARLCGHYHFLCWPESRFRRLVRAQADRPAFSLVIANDLDTMPLARRFAREYGAKVLLDAHEYTPEMGRRTAGNLLLRRSLWIIVCRRCLPEVDAMTTVGEGIARKYQGHFGVNPTIITNAVAREELEPSETDSNTIELVHHGIVTRGRRLENLLELIDLLEERFHLHLLLMPSRSKIYRDFFARAEKHPRITLHEPVPTTSIARAINRFDIGIHLLPPICFNHLMALPNKFFEFVQARLAVATWPSPEMARLVRDHRLGIVSGDFTVESMARALNRLTTAEIREMKENSHRAAGELCAQRNIVKIREIVAELLERK